MTIPALYNIFLSHPSISTDTRHIHPGDIFFALKGPSFNGNTFAEKALAAGASYVVVDEQLFADNDKIICVDDALDTLQQLAKHHRKQFTAPLIAITGTNGKTTTKELVSAVLGSHYTTYTTYGNLNNHIGVPLTLLKIKPGAEMIVVEMGANHQKEIEGYCQYTLPDFGLVTNVGKAHLEGFGGVEGVKKGKGELFDYLRQHNGTAFACSDFDYLHDMTNGVPHIQWYGSQQGEVVGTVLQSEPFVQVNIAAGFSEPWVLQTQLVGDYNLYNILAAVAIGQYFKVPVEKIKLAIENYSPSNSRSQLMEKEGNKIILDAYNANPSSMKAAIKNFAKLQADNKMIFLGGMMELGEESLEEHTALLQLIAQHEWKEVVLVGGDFANLEHPYRYFANSDLAADWWQKNATPNNYLLVKGSRSMKMERIVG